MIPKKESQSLIKTLIIASRPKTLLASLSPVLLGIALAYREKPTIDLNIAITIFLIVICAFLIQILSNFVNDLWDHYKGSDTNERIGPIRVVQAGMISPERMRKVTYHLTIIILLIGAILVFKGGPVILIIGLLSIFGAYLYTAGPYPLAHNGLGELFVVIFFGPIPVFGTYYLLNNQISTTAALLGLPIGILASCILQVNNLRDFKEDYKSNKRTLAVKFGLPFAYKLFNISLLLSLTIAITIFANYLEDNKFLLLGLFYPVCIILIKKLRSIASGKEFNEFLPKVAIFLFIFSLSLSTLLSI